MQPSFKISSYPNIVTHVDHMTLDTRPVQLNKAVMGGGGGGRGGEDGSSAFATFREHTSG